MPNNTNKPKYEKAKSIAELNKLFYDPSLFMTEATKLVIQQEAKLLIVLQECADVRGLKATTLASRIRTIINQN